MKKFIYTLIVLAIFSVKSSFSQTDSKGFNFQGYAIDPDGKAMGNSAVWVQFSIYPQGGSDEYTEKISLTTDAFGVFTAVIGSKTPSEFAAINFNAKAYRLRVQVSKTEAGEYTEISDGLLQSVPYARSASNGVPVGSIIPFGGPTTSIPDGWMACDGRMLNKYNYPQLFNAIGYSWGGSSNNFYIPDLRGYFLRGVADVQSTDPDKSSRTALQTGGNIGNNVGSYQTDDVKPHLHTGTTDVAGSHTHQWKYGVEGDDGYTGSSYNEYTRVPGSDDDAIAPSGNHTHTFTTNNSNGSESRPKNAYVWFIIKY
jgi:microcystin-dependent protein